jgi:hypothetical protein
MDSYSTTLFQENIRSVGIHHAWDAIIRGQLIEALHRRVNALGGLEFEDGEPAVPRAGQHINHGAIGRRTTAPSSHNDSAARSREKIFYRFDQRFRSHGKGISAIGGPVCKVRPFPP